MGMTFLTTYLLLGLIGHKTFGLLIKLQQIR